MKAKPSGPRQQKGTERIFEVRTGKWRQDQETEQTAVREELQFQSKKWMRLLGWLNIVKNIHLTIIKNNKKPQKSITIFLFSNLDFSLKTTIMVLASKVKG